MHDCTLKKWEEERGGGREGKEKGLLCCNNFSSAGFYVYTLQKNQESILTGSALNS